MNRFVTFCGLLLVLAACGTVAPATLPAPTDDIVPVVALESRLLDDAPAAAAPGAGELAPDFQFTLEDGTTMRLRDLQGKQVIINFWATWCVPCRDEMPYLQQAAQENSDTLVVIGINRRERLDAIKPFAEEVGVGFPLVADPKGAISDRYGVRVMPTTFFINSDGTINPVTERNLATGGELVSDAKLGPMTYVFVQQQLEQLQ